MSELVSLDPIEEDERNGFNNVCEIVLTSSELFFTETEAAMVNNVLNTERSIQRFRDFVLNKLREGVVNDGSRDIYGFVLLTRKLHRIWFNLKPNGSVFPVSEDFEEGSYFSSSSISRSTVMEGFKNTIPLITLMKTDDLFKKIDDSFQSDTYEIDPSSVVVVVVDIFKRRMNSIEQLRWFLSRTCLINERVSKIAESASEASIQFIFASIMELILDQLNERTEYNPFHFATPGSSTPCKRNKEFPPQSCSDIIIAKQTVEIEILSFIEIKKNIVIGNINESIKLFYEKFIDGEEASLKKLSWFFRNLSVYSINHISTEGLSTDGRNNFIFAIQQEKIDAKNFESLENIIIKIMNSKTFKHFSQNDEHQLVSDEELMNVLKEFEVSNIVNENCFEVLRFIKRNLVEEILLDFEDISAQLGSNNRGPISLTPKLRSFEKLLGPGFVFLPIGVFDFSSETPIQAVWLSYLFYLTTSDIKQEEELKSLEKLDGITRIKSEENSNSGGRMPRDPTFSPSSSLDTQNSDEDFSNYSSQAQDEMLVNNTIDQQFFQDMEKLTDTFSSIKLADDVNLVD